MSDTRDGRTKLGQDDTILSDVRGGPGTMSDDITRPRVIVAETGTPDRGPDAAAPTLASPDDEAPPAQAHREPVIGDVLAEKYELVRLLGVGGMGQVFKGQHLTLGVPVAVKVMHPHIAAQRDYVRRFAREAHAASLLSHPNVVRVLDFGEDQGLLFLVMEYLHGRSLGRWLDEQRGLPPLREVEAIMTALFEAFEVAHAYGIVHRDLKPDNVHLTEVGHQRVVKVLDFGLAHVDDARDAGPSLTKKDMIAGTPEYMSPEQCRSLKVGPSADLYSLGCILTELLQLRPPFRGNASIDVIARHMFSPPPALTRPPDAEPVPPLLERLRLDLLAKAPEKRPRDAAEAKARLREAMSPEATAERLPERKVEIAAGTRAERAPTWESGHETPTRRVEAPESQEIGLWRLAQIDGGVGPQCETGLASLGLLAVPVQTAADAAAEGLAAVTIDAADDLDGARRALADLKKAAPACRVVVCAAGLTTERMNALVAAGAADVVRYPVTPDVLGKKLARVLRRGR
jgi:serine/threonine protein kinase